MHLGCRCTICISLNSFARVKYNYNTYVLFVGLFACLFIILVVTVWNVFYENPEASAQRRYINCSYLHTKQAGFYFLFMFDYHFMLFFNIPLIAPVRQHSCYGDGWVCPLFPSPPGWLSASLIQLQYSTWLHSVRTKRKTHSKAPLHW